MWPHSRKDAFSVVVMNATGDVILSNMDNVTKYRKSANTVIVLVVGRCCCEDYVIFVGCKTMIFVSSKDSADNNSNGVMWVSVSVYGQLLYTRYIPDLLRLNASNIHILTSKQRLKCVEMIKMEAQFWTIHWHYLPLFSQLIPFLFCSLSFTYFSSAFFHCVEKGNNKESSVYHYC